MKTMLWVMALAGIASLFLTLERWRRIHEEEARDTEAALQRVHGEPGSTKVRVFDESRP